MSIWTNYGVSVFSKQAMKKLSGFLVIVVIGIAGAALCQAQTTDSPRIHSAQPKAEQILTRFVDVIGGAPAYDNIRSLKSKETITNWDQEQYQFERCFKSPDKWLTVEHRSKREVRPGYDGKVEWIQDGKNKAKRAHRPYDLESAVGFDEIVHWSDSLKKVRFFGETELFDRKAYVVCKAYVLKVVGVCPATLYFDQETGLLVRRDFRWEHSMEEVYYANYVDTAGVKLPRRVITVDGDTPYRYDATLTDMTTNQLIDDAMFASPTR